MRPLRFARAALLVAGVGIVAYGHVSHAAPSKRPNASPRAAASNAWHAKTPEKAAPNDASGRPMLVLQALNHPTNATLAAHDDHGGFTAYALDQAAHVLREPSTGNEHPVDPRVLDLVYRVQVHFNAPEIRIISGYRTPKKNGTSNHGKGRAIDLVVPGASDEDVAKFAREEGFVGVGVYPTSGFVHLDIRDRSYFWVDFSGPGRRNRARGILADLAARSDAAATARGKVPPSPLLVATDVDAALAQVSMAGRASSSAGGASGAANEDDDVDSDPMVP